MAQYLAILGEVDRGERWFVLKDVRDAVSYAISEINKSSGQEQELRERIDYLKRKLAAEVQTSNTARFRLGEAETRASALVVELDLAKENVKAQVGNERAIVRLEQEKAVLEQENEALYRDKSVLAKQAADDRELAAGIVGQMAVIQNDISELINRYVPGE